MSSFSLFGGQKKPVNRIINRDPNNEINLQGVSIKGAKTLQVATPSSPYRYFDKSRPGGSRVSGPRNNQGVSPRSGTDLLKSLK